jgi:hypothetical protein
MRSERRVDMGRIGIAAAAIALALVGAAPSAALTVTHETSSFDGTIAWSCPGPDPIEHYTLTTRTTTFTLGDRRVREMHHSQWRGWITNRETGALIRDNGTWNDVYIFEGKQVVRAVTTGAVWRFTVPGHGIVVHQTGRLVFEPGGDEWSTPFGGFTDISKLCAYV